MVAPTRTPQARGVKCDLCRKILVLATWLDQTKLAKTIKEAQVVLDLIQQHVDCGCLCMPKNIENLLIGSTHFEIHRLVIKRLDYMVHKRQYDSFLLAKQKSVTEAKKNQHQNINDCKDARKTSRFKIYPDMNNQKCQDDSKLHLKHLTVAIDYWKKAMEDQSSLFNSKLALRLGLTHHVIYACYLFKFYKLLKYQLLTANLVLNLFKAIEGVTANAILHAEYLFIRSLLDCDQLTMARHYLKQALKSPNYLDKTHYESILLACVNCELSLLEASQDIYSELDELATLAIIQPEDKLQHYYARTLALSTIIKYIHCHPSKSELCFEFYHTYRYLCAIIRRCYESSFEIVLWDKDNKQQTNQPDGQKNQILDHSWIKFALCDFVYSTFDLLTNFYLKAGLPECLELLYNGLNLISYRSGSYFWQTRIASIGASLDIICDKYDSAEAKFDIMSKIIGYLNDSYLMNLLRLDLDIGMLALLEKQTTVIKKDLTTDLIQRAKNCYKSWINELSKLELFDAEANSFIKLSNNLDYDNNTIVVRDNLGQLSFKTLKIEILAMLKEGDESGAKELLVKLGQELDDMTRRKLEYYGYSCILEMLLYFSYPSQSEKFILQEIKSSQAILKIEHNVMKNITIHLSTLSVNDEDKANGTKTSQCSRSRKPTKLKTKLIRAAGRSGNYDVASKSKKILNNKTPLEPVDALKNLTNMEKEEIVTTYLRYSGPNPDYLLYRQANEIMFSLCLKNESQNQDRLLYHFCELSTSNSMRYRWMMFEEQQISPFESNKIINKRSNGSGVGLKQLGFCNVLVSPEQTLKLLIKSIPEDYRLLQFKYILDKEREKEHLICACFDSSNQSFFVDASRTVSSDSIFQENGKLNRSIESLTLPSRLMNQIAEAKKTLFFSNYRSRTEARQKIETELGGILYDMENDWLGPFRFLLCGKIIDKNYDNFINNLSLDIMSDTCNSQTALRAVLENGPIISRTEFCQLIGALFNCSSSSDKARSCYKKWLKSMETFVNNSQQEGSINNTNKLNFVQKLPRGQIGLILDNYLELLPLESLPIVRILKQGIFRVPSVRLFNVLASQNGRFALEKLDTNQTVYLLDPAGNLMNTRERFESKLKSQTTWEGTISQAPASDLLELWLKTKEVYLFIGHGAGTTYYKSLCKGRGLTAMTNIRTVSIVMGCSSGVVQSEGPHLESFGIGWMFVFRGSISYVGLLWDVTDTDIDKFLDTLLGKWMQSQWLKDQELEPSSSVAITEAVAQARHVCQFKFLVGSTPVVYGLPVWCKNK